MRRWQRIGTECGSTLGLLLGVALASAVLPAAAGGADLAPLSPEGIWLTEDRDGAIEIYRCGDRLCGRLVWFDDTPAPDRRHSGMPAGRRPADPADAPGSLCRIQLIGDLVRGDERTWENGWIRDPEAGLTYSARLTLESETTLRVRGYIGLPLLGGSQLWTRAPADQALCVPESGPESGQSGPG